MSHLEDGEEALEFVAHVEFGGVEDDEDEVRTEHQPANQVS